MVLGTSSEMLKKATSLNAYLAIAVGAGITLIIQSSSVVTSVLTPLVGVGILPLEKMMPLTLGANLGTTGTAVMASMVSASPKAVQVALCHLFFNLSGILIWYPIPFMRQVPINMARGLGAATKRYRAFPLIYIVVAFVIVPGVLMGVSSLFEMGSAFTVLGTMLVIAIILSVGYTVYWYKKKGGKEALSIMLADRQEAADARKGLVAYQKSMRQEIDELKATIKNMGGSKPEDKEAAVADVKVHVEE